jgi:uncharacterized protein YndB with AHSA1/START domain
MKRWTLIVTGTLLALIVGTFIAGSFLPRDHVATGTVEVAALPERVWAVISNFEATPIWRDDVTAIRIDPPGEDGKVRFTETSSNGEIPFEVIRQDPPHRQVVRVIDDDLPFGGIWTWDLEPAGAGTRVTITEAGFIKNPAIRVMGALFFSPADTINGYLAALATHMNH